MAASPEPAAEAAPPAADPTPPPFVPPPPPPSGPVGELAKNSVFAELLGPGVAYSLNYERIVGNAVGIRVGVSGWGGSTRDSSSMVVTVPVMISFLGIRDTKNIFEVGGGGVFLYSGNAHDNVSVVTVAGSGGIAALYAGYRLHPVDKIGFQFRAGLGIQAMFVNDQSLIYPWPYLSFGAGF